MAKKRGSALLGLLAVTAASAVAAATLLPPAAQAQAKPRALSSARSLSALVAYVDHDPSDITINPNPVTAGATANVTVTLTGPTTNSGKVDLATNNSGWFASLPSEVDFAAGQTSQTVTVQIAATAWGAASLAASTPTKSVQTSAVAAANNG